MYIYRRIIPTIKIVKNWLYYSNNRAVIDEFGDVRQVSNYYPFGGVFSTTAYNHGDDLQPYKYNGKELDRTHGLDWYDYGARNYDAFLPMFTSLDPHCESYYNVSPYVYCGNNPILLVDPNGMDWYSTKDSVLVNGKISAVVRIRYTECCSQEQLSKKGIKGEYLGETVVVFDGYYDEKLGTDNKLGGPDSKCATATVYGEGGEKDITKFRAFTMTSDFDKYGAIADGCYDVSWRDYAGSGKIPKNYMLNNCGPIDTIDGNRNDNGYSTTQKNEIFIHRTNLNGYAGGRVSVGCLLIDGRQWGRFEQKVGKKSFKVILQRK